MSASLHIPVDSGDLDPAGEVGRPQDIHLTEMRESDVSSLVGFLNDKDIYLRTLSIPFPYRDEDAKKFLQSVEKATANLGHPVHFAIRGHDEQLMGVCGFERLSHGHHAEIGYWLGRPFWGRGIMTDVVRAASAMSIREWNLVRLTAHVFEFNAESARVLEKNGYQFEGLLRKHVYKDGKFIDAKLYALVVDDDERRSRPV